ncbi:LysR family transcriptional regulator [Ammoniphilus sp. 3BR4]|uniref:LysR family transcriptional regulator n=1 Tax=Ammoniphilus sp. 3BR4 TaxID=3158265 RepID=UPI003466154F
MNYDQLHAFYYVSKVMNFTKASEILNLTQPAITARIRNLEMELSCQLFDKQGKQLSLTKEGKLLLDYAERIIFYSEEAKEAIQSINQEQLSIGFGPSFPYEVICKTVRDFTKKNNIYIQIIEGHDSISLGDQVKNQKIDLSFIRIPVYDPNLTLEYLYKDKMVMFVSPDHPLASKTSVTKHDLHGQTMIHYCRNIEMWRRIEESLVGVKDLKGLEVHNLEMLKKFVKEGIGFSILPRFGLLEEVEKGELKVLDYDLLNGMPRDIMAVYHTGSSRTGWIKEFISTFEHHIKDHSLEHSL